MNQPMTKWRCTVCAHIYDPALGDPTNDIPPGTPFENIPEGWLCPGCGEMKENFEPMDC
jgi:rubredoxin